MDAEGEAPTCAVLLLKRTQERLCPSKLIIQKFKSHADDIGSEAVCACRRMWE